MAEPAGSSDGVNGRAVHRLITSAQTRACYRFRDFELRPDTRELSRNGIRIRLQIKPFQLLHTLIERPGDLVTREELRNKLWPSGTFVDFESGLNTAMNRLRSALGDSVEEPIYIETLPRLGYRFICPLLYDDPSDAQSKPVSASSSFPPPLPQVRISPFQKWLLPSLAVLAAISLAFWFRSSAAGVADPWHPRFKPVSFRGDSLISARFIAPTKVIYSVRRSDIRQSFVTDLNGSGSDVLPEKGVVVAASDRGDFVLASKNTTQTGLPFSLLRGSVVPGRKAVPLSEDTSIADFTADGKQLAVVVQSGAESVLEFPRGHVLYRSQGWINGLRVSRNGREVAFLEHPVRDDDAGDVRIVDISGNIQVLTPEWGSADGLAWSPSGSEIWFTASRSGSTRSLYTVNRSHKVRRLSTQPSSLRLLDVASDGRTLLAVDDARMVLRTVGSDQNSDISQFDFSHVDDITRDGNVLLFTEGGDAGGRHYSAYVYDRASRVARQFGQGRALALSFDGKRALTVDPQDRSALTLYELQSGQSRRVNGRGFRYQWAKFSNKEELLVGGSYPAGPLVIGYQNIGTGSIATLPGLPYLDDVALSPDGAQLAGRRGGMTEIVNLRTLAVQRPPADSRPMPVVWSADSKRLFLLTSNRSVYSIVAYDPSTGQSASWKTIEPRGGFDLAGIAAAPLSDSYAYSVHLSLSRLYVVEGLS